MAAALTIGACAVTGERGAALEPGVVEGKPDVVDRVELRGELALGQEGAARAELTEDLEFHGYTLAVRAGAVVTLDVTQAGSSRALDSTLFVYGPRAAEGGYGSAAIAFDDDAGWGRLSRLRALPLSEGGAYLVVVGTHDGRGRGRYRLLATCESGDCAPTAPEDGGDGELDGACVFGERYGDLFGRAAEAIVVIGGRVLTAATALTELERRQVVAAVAGSTAHSEVTTAEEAFAAVDRNEVNEHELWDASSRRAFTAYEVGAGDNSFGMIFVQGTTEPAATVNDGDLVGCRATWGPERRPCAADSDCADGLRCTGVAGELSRGRCIDWSRDDHPAIGSDCEGAAGCPAGSGLVCAGATPGAPGLCLPGWMRGRYTTEPDLAIPDGDPTGVEVPLVVYGLATVDMDVRIDLVVSHPRIADLRVTLTSAGGTEVSVFDGSRDGPELVLTDARVAGFPGDEGVNGQWSLRVVDDRPGSSGTVQYLGLTITSRWD